MSICRKSLVFVVSCVAFLATTGCSSASQPISSGNSIANATRDIAMKSPATASVATSALGQLFHFDPAAWKGMGEMALLLPKKGSGGLGGSTLVILAKDATRPVVLAKHATFARFSPDGKWLAVVTQQTSGSQKNPKTSTTLSLMSATGKEKQTIATSTTYDLQGSWSPHTNQFLFIDGKGELESVRPGHGVKGMHLNLAKNIQVADFRLNPQTDAIAIDEVIPNKSGQSFDRHDRIQLWNPKTGNLHTIATAPRLDGFLLGPWTNDGKHLFYWTDPQHSASMAADGLPLRAVDKNGRTQLVASPTLTGRGIVVPYGQHEALIQTGGSRYFYDKKQIALWNGTTAKMISPAKDVTQLWPTVDGGSQVVAFSEGPVSTGVSGASQVNAWWNQLQLVTMSLRTDQRHIIRAAGKGVNHPLITADGKRILFLKGSQLAWVNRDGAGSVHTVLRLAKPGELLFPQQGVLGPIAIADWRDK